MLSPGGEAVGDDELVDVLGVGGSVGDDEEAAVGVAAEIDFGEVEVVADGVEVGYLGVHGLRGGGVGEGRGSGAALVVEDDLAVLGEALPDVVLDHVDVGEAGASIDCEDGGCLLRCAVDPVGEVDVGGVDVAGGRR